MCRAATGPCPCARGPACTLAPPRLLLPPEVLPLRVRTVRVKNLRAVRDCTLALGNLTALVGPNGAGKSTFLYALDLFQGTAAACREDYYNRDTSRDIEIQVVLAGLRDSEVDAFSPHAKDGELCVAHTIRWERGKARHSLRSYSLSDPRIDAVLDAPDEATARSLYARLYENPHYNGLPAWPGPSKARGVLQEWKSLHPEKCDVQYGPGEFLGNTVMGAACLAEHVWFLRVHAVRDAAGTGRDGRGPALEDLLDAIVRGAPARGGAAAAEPPSGLAKLGAAVCRTLDLFAPGEKVEIEYVNGAGPGGRAPRAKARLVEGGYSSPVGAAGHGLQRAFVAAAALHQLPRAQAPGVPHVGDPPAVVLAIEEPELYQHPTRLHHIAGRLRAMSEEGLEGVAGGIQVLYTTHSPLLVSADRIGEIRLVRKVGGGDKPAATKIASTTPADILAELKRCEVVRRGTRDIDYSLLRAMGPAASEGFFADTVVLVEGPSDQAALRSVAEAMGRPLDAMGVSIVPCESKSAMPLPIAMLRRLGIRVYAVWDADQNEGKQAAESKKILSILGYRDHDWRGKTTDTFACLHTNLEDAIRDDLWRAPEYEARGSDPYAEIIRRRAREHGLGKVHSKPLKVHLVMEEVRAREIRLPTLEAIVREIAAGLPGAGGT